MTESNLSRRGFLFTAATAPLILPRNVFGANRKLDVGFIGMGGQIQGHVRNAIQFGHNVVAFCDVDPNQIARSRERHKDYPGAIREHGDYRQLIEKEKLDAVVIATPDHWHAPICTAALQAGLHVYCEKPLTHTVGEARALRELARTAKGVTQTGNQGSASPNLRRSIELIQAGFFGDISNVHVWHPAHGWPNGVPRPEGEDAVPAGMNWDFWCGPAPVRPYRNGQYHPAKWRGWYDFGNGSIGDFCCHSFNMPVRALELGYPERVEVRDVSDAGLESYARTVTHVFRFPARDGRAAVNLIYYTGGPNMPPKALTDQLVGTFGEIPRVGAIVEGEKGLLSAGLWNSQCYVKLEGEEKFVGAGKHSEAMKIPQTLPRVRNHLQEWTDAIVDGGETFAPFELGGQLTEIGLSGVVALRLQQDLDWDGEGMVARGLPAANAFIHKQNREVWL